MTYIKQKWSKKTKTILILIIAIPLAILLGIDAIQSQNPTLFLLYSIGGSISGLIYHYVTKDVLDSKFVRKNT